MEEEAVDSNEGEVGTVGGEDGGNKLLCIICGTLEAFFVVTIAPSDLLAELPPTVVGRTI